MMSKVCSASITNCSVVLMLHTCRLAAYIELLLILCKAFKVQEDASILGVTLTIPEPQTDILYRRCIVCIPVLSVAFKY